MYKLGIITADEVYSSYLNMGFTPAWATKLQEFCVKYNDALNDTEISSDEAKIAKLNDETEAAVVKAYKERLIDEAAAISMLESLGYTTEGINMLLAQADFDNAESLLTSQITLAHDSYTRSIWDRGTTLAYLNKLNLLGEKVDVLLSTWDIEKTGKPAKPTKAELNAWLEKALISESTYRAELKSMGYSDKYINLYVEIERAKGAKGATKGNKTATSTES
jgi:hypothetical protein